MRNITVEYLRILFMALIVLLHMMQYGYGEADIIDSTAPISYIQLLLIMFGKLGVPGFVFITGYYGVKLSGKRLSSLLVQLSFYSLISIILCVIVLGNPFPVRSFIGSFLPLAGGWWFIEDYIILMLFSPLINAGIERVSKKQYNFIVISLIVIIYGIFWFKGRASAMSLLLFFSLYVIGRYIALYPVSYIEKRKVPILCLSLMMLTVLPIFIHYIGKNDLLLKFIITYYNIFTLSTIVSLFLICNASERLGKGNFITRNVIAVYLVHCSAFGQDILNNYVINKSEFNLFYILFIVIVVFLLSSVIEEMRKRLCTKMEKYLEICLNSVLNN